MDEDLALATLFAARALHDLASPMGSAYNALELAEDAEDDADLRRRSMQMAMDALETARTRLDLLRAGLAHRHGAPFEPETLRKPIEGAARNCNAEFSWSGGQELLPAAARPLCACLVLTALESAPRARALSVELTKDERCATIHVEVTGAPLRVRDESRRVLDGANRSHDADPRGAFASACRRWADALGARIAWMIPEAEDALRLSAEIPVDTLT